MLLLQGIQVGRLWRYTLRDKINKDKSEVTYGDLINVVDHWLMRLEISERYNNHFIDFRTQSNANVSRDHPGNQRVQELFLARLSEYRTTTWNNKRAFTKLFWQDLAREGIEFYQYIDDHGPEVILIEKESEKGRLLNV